MKRIVSAILCIILGIFGAITLSSCDAHEHSGTEWKSDTTHHWHVCEICNSTFDSAEHEYEESVNGSDTVQTCKICQYSYVPNSVPEHDHTYGDSLSHNEAFHFKACTFEGCPMQSEKEEHIFGTPEIVQEADKITKTYPCQACEYVKVETVTIDTVIKNDADWTLAFKNLEIKNFQLTVSFKDAGGNVLGTNECIITDDGAYVKYGGSNFIVYTRKNADGSFNIYANDENNNWKLYTDAEGEFYNSFAVEAILEIDYSENFEDFTYDETTGKYVCTDNIECKAYAFGGDSYQILTCFNNVVKVADGKISHIECDYTFEDSGEGSQSFIYYNIGIAEFEIPEDIKANAVSGGTFEDMEMYR